MTAVALPSLRRKIHRSFLRVVLLYGVFGLFLVASFQIASGTSPKMIHRNYDSISAAIQMDRALDALRDPEGHPSISGTQAHANFEQALSLEERNITEPGEREIAQAIRTSWNSIQTAAGPPPLKTYTALSELLDRLIAVNERGMFLLAQDNATLGRRVLTGAIAFFLLSLIAAIAMADGLAIRIATPLKSIAEALHRRPSLGRRLKLVEPDTLELLILTNELTRLWERVVETDKVNVRETLQQKSKLESVLESVEDALLVVDPNGLISHANGCLCELLGLTAKDLIGQPWRDLPTLGENYLKLRPLLNIETPDQTEVDLLLRGIKRQYSMRAREISSPADGPLARLYLLHDITEKRQRDRFRSEFIDMLSHEIKTPLQSLGTATELLGSQRGKLPGELQPLIETITEDVDRIKAVANEFVQITQSHARVMRLKEELTALNQVMPDWIKPFHIVARDRGVNLAFRHEGSEVIWANLDRVKFPWVISNLLSNAIRFAPAGSEVSLLLTDRNGAVEIQVKDEGPGISPEDQRRMFEPFFQGVATTTTGAKGLFGIGLTIAKEVVEAHDGRIEYYPLQPRGSEFRILLPFPPA